MNITLVKQAVINILAETRTQTNPDGEGQSVLFEDAEQAIAAAKKAQKQLSQMTLEKRGQIIAALRKASLENAEYLAKLANKETGYGKWQHKLLKNRLAAEKTPGIEDLHAVALQAITE